ncbi:MAG: hypothetical protein H6985_19155 [Pseudomonadales bacterium]|nr:hypothetical protein [Pseudomonadales bacterium]
MNQALRPSHMDVSNTVDVTDPSAVSAAVRGILEACHPRYDFSGIDGLVADFSRLYAGDFPGFRACEIRYHDTQHVLDVTLAMARLLAGHEAEPGSAGPLGPELALAGIAAALFHDSGYIRRVRDNRHKNGAAYTRVHVSRGARFMADYLPQVNLGELVGVCTRIVQFTGYETDPRNLPVASDKERCLGALLGTADLIAQMADVDYLRKCHDHLYEEFEIGGFAGEYGSENHSGMVYRSRNHLLETTPEFIRTTIELRLERQFGGVYRCAGRFFGGRNFYMDAIFYNCRQLQALLSGAEPAVNSHFIP